MAFVFPDVCRWMKTADLARAAYSTEKRFIIKATLRIAAR